MIKLVVTDLDNTLLHSDKTISDYTVEIFKKCYDKNIKIALATARSKQAASDSIKIIDPDIFIGYGGSLAYVNNKVVHKAYMPVDLCNKLIYDLKSQSQVECIYVVNENTALTNDMDFVKNAPLLNPEYSHYIYNDLCNPLDKPMLKISAVCSNPSVIQKISKKYPCFDIIEYSGENLYRFANVDAVKWKAVQSVSKYLGLENHEIVCFGDDLNDMEMIQKAGLGIAVENAIRSVKSVSNQICQSNNNDGVAKWIESNLL